MPLVRHADRHHAVRTPNRVGAERQRVRAQQRRIRADKLVEQRRVRGRDQCDQLVARRIGADAVVRHGERVRHFAFAHGNYQRVILHDVRRILARRVVRLRGDGIDVDAAAKHGHGIMARQQRRQQNVFDVVDRVQIRRIVRVPRLAETEVRRNVVAEINITGVHIGDDEIQIVDQLDRGGGIAGRVRPHQRRLQLEILRERVRIRVDRHRVSMAVAGRQRCARILVRKEARTFGRGAAGRNGRDAAHRHAALDVVQAPALKVDAVRDRQPVIGHRPRAVDEQCFHQRRAGREAELVGEIILDQRQHAGHIRRRHARAGFIAVVRRELFIHPHQHRFQIAQTVRRQHLHRQIVIHRKAVGVAHREGKAVA